jgi:Icc-related predicted phosphoesterase
MKLFAISDIHGATKPINEAASLIREADWVVIAGDITRSKTRAEAAEVIACIEQYSKNILAVHGNWEEKGYSLHAQSRVIDGIGFLGLGGSSPTPIHTATEYSEQEIALALQTGYAEIKGASQVVLVSHVPPRGVRDRSFIGLRGGSRSVKEFLELNPVNLCLCGHIHEASGVEYFGGTLVANSGSFKKGRYLTVETGPDIVATPGKVDY